MRIGILGGGQLAMMMIQKCHQRNNKLDFLVVDPGENPPASKFMQNVLNLNIIIKLH